MTRTHFTALALCLLLPLSACGGDDEETTVEETQDQMQDLCIAEQLADDDTLNADLGEMGDPANWGALPPGAVIASTYLRLPHTDEGTATFGQLIGPIIGELMAPAPGLLGVSFSNSTSCNTARTMTAWESEDAMMNFVLGEAHLNAIQRTGEVSRGGSLTGQWMASDLEDFKWETVIDNFKDHDGPVY